MNEVQSNKTPSTLEFLIVGPMKEIKKISVKDQQENQLGMGMLLYLVKHSCPNLANASMELLQGNCLKQMTVHTLQPTSTPMCYQFGLKIKPMGNSNEPWEIVCFNNSDYAEDPVSRQSISGFILYVLGVPVS